MKNCLEEYRDCKVDEIAEKYIEGTPQVGEVAVAPDESNGISMIQGVGNEATSLTEGTVTYDIRFLATAPVSGELIRLIINLDYSDFRIIPINLFWGLYFSPFRYIYRNKFFSSL